jgi:hypothetical protein
MGLRDTQAVGFPVESNCLAQLSEFVVTAKVFAKRRLRRVNFYDWTGWDPLNYKRDDAAKRYLVRRAKPIDVEVVLDQRMIEKGYEIVWEA